MGSCGGRLPSNAFCWCRLETHAYPAWEALAVSNRVADPCAGHLFRQSQRKSARKLVIWMASFEAIRVTTEIGCSEVPCVGVSILARGRIKGGGD
jgi:hypothetical protein